MARLEPPLPDRVDTGDDAVLDSRVDNLNQLLQFDKMRLISLLGSRVGERDTQGGQHRASAGRLFLSYAHADETIACDLYDQLRVSGFCPWMDVRDLHPGEDWRLAIESAIQECDFFILCLSPNSIGRRGFLQREIRIALDRVMELLDHDIYFVVRLSPCPRPNQIAKYQTVDLYESNGYDRLVTALNEGIARRDAGNV